MFASASLADQSFIDIQAKLTEHFSPRVNTIVERYRFHTMKQKELQTDDFIIQLRNQAMRCSFDRYTS